MRLFRAVGRRMRPGRIYLLGSLMLIVAVSAAGCENMREHMVPPSPDLYTNIRIPPI